MRAARYDRFGGPEVLEIVDLPEPHAAPGTVRVAVRAAGLNASDWRFRRGQMGGDLPQTTGHDVAGVVDEVGPGVAGVAVGDRVFGLADDGQGIGTGAAEYAVLAQWATMPASVGFEEAAALPVAAGTATRGLDALHVGAGTSLLISGAAGGIGSAAVQLAAVRGARVIGTAGAANQDYVRSLGADPVVYGDGMPDRVRALAPGGVDRALDVAGSGVLPQLIALAGGADHVVTLADLAGAERYGVRFSRGGDHRESGVLADVARLVDAGRFRLPVDRTFPLDDIVQAHRLLEQGHVRGRLVLRVSGPAGS